MRRSVKAVAALVALVAGGCGSGTGVMHVRGLEQPEGERCSWLPYRIDPKT